jgi:hypothetical protein
MATEAEDQAEALKAVAPESVSQDDDTTKDDESDSASDDTEEEEDEEDDDEDDEPKLKYARLTGSLVPVYRNGDATSAFLVAGDKMVSLIGRFLKRY